MVLNNFLAIKLCLVFVGWFWLLTDVSGSKLIIIECVLFGTFGWEERGFGGALFTSIPNTVHENSWLLLIYLPLIFYFFHRYLPLIFSMIICYSLHGFRVWESLDVVMIHVPIYTCVYMYAHTHLPRWTFHYQKIDAVLIVVHIAEYINNI